MSHRDSECLEASWDNNSWPDATSYQVRSVCSDYGKVVAKVDIKDGSDHTLHLNNSNWRRDSGWYRIRWIYCCTDIGDLCNRADMHTDASCREGFEDNDDLDDCTLDAGSTGAHANGNQCVFSASCLDDDGQPNQTTGSTERYNVKRLLNCDGVLTKANSCPES